MTYLVGSPGSCGEFIQGYAEGSSLMVACPINRYSYAKIERGISIHSLPDKAEAACRKCLKYLRISNDHFNIQLSSEIPKGKGLASSTADISSTVQAIALINGRVLTEEEIADLAISVEPSDATFFKGMVQFDYRNGRLLKRLGMCPPMQILIYDCGGEIDTMQFNSRKDLVELQKMNEPEIQKALDLFKMGIEKQSLDWIGQAASISAFANQKILYKKQLEPFYQIGMALGGKGVICAHSGTVLGLILPAGKQAGPVKQEIDRVMGNEICFLDLVHVINSGLTYRRL